MIGFDARERPTTSAPSALDTLGGVHIGYVGAIVLRLSWGAMAACLGETSFPEERGMGGLGDLPPSDPGSAPGASLADGAPLCAPCASDDACGAGALCNALVGMCEHVDGYCSSNTRGLRSLDGIDRIVIHTAEGPADATVEWFRSKTSRVSAHYVVDREGWVRLVASEAVAAKHAGNLDLDRRSIGIELEGWVDRPAESYTAAVYDSVASVVRDVAARYGIPLDREHVIGHVEVADTSPGAEYCGGWGHHADPGGGFDWARLLALVRGEGVTEPPNASWMARAAFNPVFLAVSHPPSARPGDLLQVTLRAHNAGRYVWEQTRLRLVAADAGAQELFAYGHWASRQRPTLGGLGCHGPDTTADLTFLVRVPEADRRRTAGGAFHLELLDRSFRLHRSEDFVVSFEVVPPGDAAR